MEKNTSDVHYNGKSKYLEVIYVADQYAIQLYGMIELPEMLLSIGNIVWMADPLNSISF